MPDLRTDSFPRRRERRRHRLRLFAALCLLLPWRMLMAGDWQPLAQLACPDGTLAIDARPHAHNAAGGMALELRYRYRGQALDAIRYEGFHANLDRYRLRDSARSYNFGLDLDTRGLSEPSGSERGDTLYLPPSRADAAEARRLADCIADHRALLHARLRDTVVGSHSMLGLMRNTATPGLDGIARLIHAESPFLGLYRHTHLLVVLRDGRVMAHTDLTADNPADAVQVGRVEQAGKGRPTLRLQARYRLRGRLEESSYLSRWPHHRSGRALQDDYRIELEPVP
jgi:hypothetical protein